MRDERNEGIGINEAEKIRVALEVSEWMTEEYIDKFRNEYKLAENLHDTAERLRGRLYLPFCISQQYLSRKLEINSDLTHIIKL